MDTKWIIQHNIGNDTEENLLSACHDVGVAYERIRVIPFSDELPEMPDIDGPFVFYGRTTLILNAYKDKKWARGMFYNPETFNPQAYLANYGNMMLNHDAQFLKVRDIPEYFSSKPDQEWFMRPNDDLKQFTGGVDTTESYLNWIKNIQDDPLLNLDTVFVICSPKEIDAEYRLFIVDGKVITGSMYQPSGSAYLPMDLIEYAEKAAAIWSPAPVFVLDIARSNQLYSIIECNCFNGSGFYLSNCSKIVRNVSLFQSTNWENFS